MGSYPTSPPWSCPITRTLTFKTGILQGVNGTEQRWMQTSGVESFTLSYGMLTVAQRDTLLTQFETSKGSFDQTLSLDFDDGNTYTGLHFDSDTLQFTEDKPNQFSGVVKLTTVARITDNGTLPSDFPALSTGAATQRPYTKGKTFDTASVRTETNRYAYARRTASLRTWSVGGIALTSTEAQAIWDMFRYAGGMWRSFGFTDPDSATRYANCRFGSDTLTWTILGPNQNSITTTIKQLL